MPGGKFAFSAFCQMRVQKKGKKGAAANYITRNRALKKLQLSLADFRRLCILKGIYPRDPPNKKKAGGGSTAPRTFYYSKDIQYLLHEPLIQKFRQHKTFLKRVSKVTNQRKWSEVRRIEKQDLDDALSMVFLFGSLASMPRMNSDVIDECAKLVTEFQHWVIESRSLRKVFLSIKGVYYQVKIHNHDVTWLVPYAFSQEVPFDVDFRVMSTFMELYKTMLGFINCKLYHDINIKYPPLLDKNADEQAGGLMSYKIASSASQATQPSEALDQKHLKEIDERMATVDEIINNPSALDVPIDIDPADAITESKEIKHEDLFSYMYVFLSRETPRQILEFVIKANGGHVGWSSTMGCGSPFHEGDDIITHQICDRDADQVSIISGRRYVQPQWIFDCVNAKKILDLQGYRIGEMLPPHLSPFMSYDSSTYKPEQAKDQSSSDHEKEDVVIEGESDSEGDIEEKDEDENEIENEADSPITIPSKRANERHHLKNRKIESDKRDLANIMLSKKDRKFYRKVVHSQQQKRHIMHVLEQKKANIKK